MGIEGVETPEKIQTKAEPEQTASEGIAEKVGSVVAEAADAAKTLIADTDDEQGHQEL